MAGCGASIQFGSNRQGKRHDGRPARIKAAIEHLADLEEELAHCRRHAIAGDGEASVACAELLDEIETQKAAILDLQAVAVMA